MAIQIDLGAVIPIGKGDWNASTVYERTNIVRHNSTAWVCKVESSTGVEPTEDSSDWYLLVKDVSETRVTSVNGQINDVTLDIISPTQVDEKINNAKNEINSNIPNVMIGASAEISGKSGLVPIPNAGDNNKCLGGDGLWHSISDSTNTDSSSSIASSKAVKTAYDVAIAALPKTGGTVTGAINMSNQNMIGINHLVFANNSELWVE